MDYTLNDFERQTLAYLLYVLRTNGSRPDPDDPDDSVVIEFDERLGGDEYRAMWELGLKIMKC